MKNTIRLTLIFAAMAVTIAACEKQEPIIDNGNSDVVVDNTAVERVILYSVGTSENRRTLARESEWNALLEQFCEQALGGSAVTFYNTNHATYSKHSTKEKTTYNTTSRDEIKQWMKEMERQGRTVRVIYDENTGTWHGEAYATAPADTTSGTLIGTWHLTCVVKSHITSNGQLQNSDLYEPDSTGGSMYYTFSTDGTVSLTITGMDGTTHTDSSTWSLSTEGVLSCELLPNGVNWNVNWITPSTMIISYNDMGTTEGDLYYQLQFEKQ